MAMSREILSFYQFQSVAGVGDEGTARVQATMVHSAGNRHRWTLCFRENLCCEGAGQKAKCWHPFSRFGEIRTDFFF